MHNPYKAATQRSEARVQGVSYEDIVFTEPFDIEAQALQKATAAKVGWRLADAFLTIALLEREFAALGSLHSNRVPLAESVPVVTRIDRSINHLVGLIVEAEGRSHEEIDVALIEYKTQHKALTDKYFSVVNITPSTAPQN
jgi:hypothetical protein